MTAIIEHQRGMVDLRTHLERRRRYDPEANSKPERRKENRRALVSKPEMQLLLRGGE